MRQGQKKWRNIVFSLTGNGRFCPKFLFKRSANTLEWYPPVKAFRLKREIKCYNLFTGMYTIRKFDRKKLGSYKKEFYQLLKEIDKNYDKLHDEYIKAHKEFTTMEFWKNYLNINN